MAIATPEELRHFLRLPLAFTEDETATAVLLLELAQGVIEDEAGQALESSTDTIVLDGPTIDDFRYQSAAGTRRMVLPRWPVTAVASVTLTDDDDVLVHGKDEDYTWSRSGVLSRRGTEWPATDQAIEVEYTAGYETWPPALKRIGLRLASVGWANPEGLSAETLGDHSRSYNTEALGMELTLADRRTVGSYRAQT
ncbi:hypothetical protein OG244_19445 [Streptomyces brevispora]|uniref:hypothetical protein n=1 Tax=Streptomyces brevispora TaxID=887462 RepID=UPI002E35D3B4|nr:hypothetical protein [Streptomyces brevispora]